MDHSTIMRIGVALQMDLDHSVIDVMYQIQNKPPSTFYKNVRCLLTLRFLIFHDAFPQSMEKITDFMLTRFIKESNFKWFPYDDDPLEDPG